MQDCMKRRLLYASSQAYEPHKEPAQRRVGWIEPPIVVRRETKLGHRQIDQALVGRVREGVVVAFRGSLPPFVGGYDGWLVLLDWLNDGLSLCVEDSDYAGGVHLGFAESVRRLWEDKDGTPGVASAIACLLDQSRCDERAGQHLFVTGHSKGGALANLAAFRAAQVPAWRSLPISVATIAAARAGNAAFALAYDASRIACLRYEVSTDLIPHLPPGPATPPWLRVLARHFGPKLVTDDYHPVGLRVAGKPAHEPWLKTWLRDLWGMITFRGISLRALTPAALAAHTICPRSGYDRLICTGEPDCGHGLR
jgi:hypothetical protein